MVLAQHDDKNEGRDLSPRRLLVGFYIPHGLQSFHPKSHYVQVPIASLFKIRLLPHNTNELLDIIRPAMSTSSLGPELEQVGRDKYTLDIKVCKRKHFPSITKRLVVAVPLCVHNIWVHKVFLRRGNIHSRGVSCTVDRI